MTYRTLLAKLLRMSEECPPRLNDAVTIYDPNRDEYLSANELKFADERTNDVLDHGHPFITLDRDL
jgi:hypothetical protein